MLAAAETAHSNDDAGPSPRCATARVSRKTVARVRHGCSSRRTISSPLRAVDFQCTRRSSSPVRYSRGMTSSSPAEATARDRASPQPRPVAADRDRGQRDDDGTTVSVSVVANCRVARQKPNGSTSCTLTGPIV